MVEARQDSATTAFVMPGDTNKDRHLTYKQAIRHCGLDPGKIENVMPCTPFQRDVMDCAAGDERCAVGHVVYEIPEDVNIERLTAAWKEVVRRTPALRTRVLESDGGVFSGCAVRRLRVEVLDKFGRIKPDSHGRRDRSRRGWGPV